MLRKKRRGVCNIKPINLNSIPLRASFDAIPELAVAVQPSDWKSSHCLCRTLKSQSVGVFVAGQCLLPLTLFMIAVRPHAHFFGGGGGEGEEKQNRRKKVTRESKLLLADPNTLSGRQ